MELKVAVKAVIIKDDKALVITRSKEEMAKSEFEDIEIIDLPGGLIETGEEIEKALHREIMEEVGLEVDIVKPILVSDHFGHELHIVGILFLCMYKSGRVVLSPEHDGYYWVTPGELRKMDGCSWAIERVELALNTVKEGETGAGRRIP